MLSQKKREKKKKKKKKNCLCGRFAQIAYFLGGWVHWPHVKGEYGLDQGFSGDMGLKAPELAAKSVVRPRWPRGVATHGEKVLGSEQASAASQRANVSDFVMILRTNLRMILGMRNYTRKYCLGLSMVI